jgi:hypothetical protein
MRLRFVGVRSMSGHEAALAVHVGAEYGGELAFHTHLDMRESSRPLTIFVNLPFNSSSPGDFCFSMA